MFEQIIGRTKEELNRLGWPQVTHPDDLEEDMKNFKQLLSGKIKMYSMDKRYIRPDGSIVWVHMIVAPLKLANDQQSYHICLVQDITGRKTMEEALHESERSKSVFLSHLPGLAYRCNYDRDWTMQYVSEGCFSLTGYPRKASYITGICPIMKSSPPNTAKPYGMNGSEFSPKESRLNMSTRL